MINISLASAAVLPNVKLPIFRSHVRSNRKSANIVYLIVSLVKRPMPCRQGIYMRFLQNDLPQRSFKRTLKVSPKRPPPPSFSLHAKSFENLKPQSAVSSFPFELSFASMLVNRPGVVQPTTGLGLPPTFVRRPHSPFHQVCRQTCYNPNSKVLTHEIANSFILAPFANELA